MVHKKKCEECGAEALEPCRDGDDKEIVGYCDNSNRKTKLKLHKTVLTESCERYRITKSENKKSYTFFTGNLESANREKPIIEALIDKSDLVKEAFERYRELKSLKEAK